MMSSVHRSSSNSIAFASRTELVVQGAHAVYGKPRVAASTDLVPSELNPGGLTSLTTEHHQRRNVHMTQQTHIEASSILARLIAR